MNNKQEDFTFLFACIAEGVPVNQVVLLKKLTDYYGRRACSANAIARDACVAAFIAVFTKRHNRSK